MTPTPTPKVYNAPMNPLSGSNPADLARTRFFPALAHRDFRHLWFAALSADAGAWAVIVARGWLAFELTKDDPDTVLGPNTAVGIVIFAAMIPYVLVPVFAGFLADRMVRRDLLAWAMGFQIIIHAATAVLALMGLIQVWHLVVIAFITGSAMATQVAGLESLTANLVPRRNLVNAYALINAAFHGTRAIGPGAIAPVLALLDIGWAFVIAGVAYIIAITLVLRIDTRSTGVIESARGHLRNLAEGFIYAYRHPVLLRVFTLVIFHCALTMSFESLLPVISESKLGTDAFGVSMMNLTVGIGALAISLVIAPLSAPHRRGRLLLINGVISGISPLGLAFASSLPLAMLATAFMGASQAGFMILSSILIQSVVPDGIRGRVTSIYILHAAGIMSFANFGNGALGDSFGPEWVLSVAGGGFLAFVVLTTLERRTRSMYIRGVAVDAVPSPA